MCSVWAVVFPVMLSTYTFIAELQLQTLLVSQTTSCVFSSSPGKISLCTRFLKQYERSWCFCYVNPGVNGGHETGKQRYYWRLELCPIWAAAGTLYHEMHLNFTALSAHICQIEWDSQAECPLLPTLSFQLWACPRGGWKKHQCALSSFLHAHMSQRKVYYTKTTIMTSCP